MYIHIATASGVALNDVGVYRYSEDNGFLVRMLAYAFDDGPIRIVCLEKGEPLPQEVVDALADGNTIKIAHEAQFARVCLSCLLGLPRNTFLCPEQWRCTRVWCSCLGLPAGLRELASIPGVGEIWSSGKFPMSQEPRPSGPAQALGCRLREELETIRALYGYLRKTPLPEIEWAHYALDQRVNDRGVRLDRPFLANAISFDEFFRGQYALRFREITSLPAACAPERFRKWLAANGVRTGSVSREAMARMRKRAPEAVEEAVRLWELLSRTATRKYRILFKAVCGDGRIRGLFRFAGHPQGQFSHPLVQLDNLPVLRSPDYPTLRDMVRSGECQAVAWKTEAVTDILTQLFSTSFIPRSQHCLLIAEYPSLEGRLLEWLVRGDAETLVCREAYVPDEQPRVSEYWHSDPRVTRLCLDIDTSIRRCLTHPGPVPLGGILFHAQGNLLRVTLPSGRFLCYREPELLFHPDGASMILWAGIGKDGKWATHQGNGATFLRDIVQGLQRDVMLDAMRRLTEANYAICLHGRDRLVVESAVSEALLAILSILGQPPGWAMGLRLSPQGRACSRYLEKYPSSRR